MKPKQYPAENEIWTRTGKLINPLNVQVGDISIIDVVHSMALNAHFGGFTRCYYSLAEHSVNMYDYFTNYWDEVLEKFDRKTKRDDENMKHIFDIKKRYLRMFTLLHYAPKPFLMAIAGGFKAYNYHYPRVAAVILQEIGLDYEEFKLCKKLLDYIDQEVERDVRNNYYSTSDRYLFWQPAKAMDEYIGRFNNDSDIQVRIINGNYTIVEPHHTDDGQFHMNFGLPAISI